jgi:UDP-glucuronate 4-epimerase
MKVFITGISGMIGFHLACKLEDEGHEVVGIDNFNDYYEVSLKHERARLLKSFHNIDVTVADITNFNFDAYFERYGKPDVIMHLAAYANPRHSMEFPYLYIDTNIVGTQRLMEAAERAGIENVVYASSSCVMHGQPLPWNETDLPTHQNNPYGWSKRVNECQFFSSKIPKTIGLRFFTVAGPWGRPDMFMHIAT